MTANKMWGGRFERGPAGIMEEINVSVDFDKRLADHDIAGSKAHARMLAVQGIIDQADADAIVQGLDRIAADIAAGRVIGHLRQHGGTPLNGSPLCLSGPFDSHSHNCLSQSGTRSLVMPMHRKCRAENLNGR